MEENVRSIGAGEGGRINVGVIYSAMPYALHYLEAYHARYPKVEFYIRLGSPQDLLNDLDRGELHVLFLRRSTQESGSLHERLLGEDALELIQTAATAPAPELPLTDRDRELARLVAGRCTNKEIAAALYLSEGTVKQYINQLYAKLENGSDHRTRRTRLAERYQKNAPRN